MSGNLGRDAAARLAVPVGDRDHARGPATASVTLVEYGDYECPYCRAAVAIVEELQRVLPDELRFVFRHFPLEKPTSTCQPGRRSGRRRGVAGEVLRDARRPLREPNGARRR